MEIKITRTLKKMNQLYYCSHNWKENTTVVAILGTSLRQPSLKAENGPKFGRVSEFGTPKVSEIRFHVSHEKRRALPIHRNFGLSSVAKLCQMTHVEANNPPTSINHVKKNKSKLSQQNLIAEMKSTCPLFVNTRWISMGKVLKWLKVKRMRLLQHFEEKKPLCTPSVDWWLIHK